MRGLKGRKKQKSSESLIGSLLFHRVEVINYLVYCIFINMRFTTGKNIGLRSIARIHSMTRRNIYGFKSRKRKVSAQF